MKKVAISLFTLTLVSMGCENKAGTGALVGGGAGAITGAAISHNASGALIGGAAGAVGGAIIGAAMESADRDSLQKQSPRTLNKIDNKEQLSVDDIKKMSKAGLSDNVIISQIQATNSVFYLSTADIIDLKNAGVSQRVIDYMIQTGNQ
ncbi:MAG: hypothetical protein JSR58_01270 [Verrucomicrobia bacterium]|nr:hypothetical protein [Verrucomicrobiota bacterium]